MLAIDDGALGFWAALTDVWPEAQEQRGWVNRVANVRYKLPKRIRTSNPVGSTFATTTCEKYPR